MKNKWIQSLLKRAKITPWLLSRVTILWSLRFTFQIGLIFSSTMIIALFADRFGFHDFLYLILADAILFFLGNLVLSRFYRRSATDRFLMIGLAMTAIFITAASLFPINSIWFLWGLILAKNFCFLPMHIGLIRKNESLFSATDSVRVMPVIDSAITIGTVVGSLIFLILLEFMPVGQLFWVWILVCGVMGYILWKNKKTLKPFESTEYFFPEKFAKNVQKYFCRFRFLKGLLAVILLQSALFAVVENEFLSSLTHHMPQAQEHSEEVSSELLQTNLLEKTKIAINHAGEVVEKSADKAVGYLFAHGSVAHTLGMLELIFGLIGVWVQIFVAPWLLKKTGVVRTMSSYFLGFLFLNINFVLWGPGMMSLIRGYQHNTHVLFESGYHISFYAIFSKAREGVRFFFEAFAKPLGVIFGIGILWIFHHYFHYVSAGAVMIALSAVLMIVMWILQKPFTEVSKNSFSSDKALEAKIHAIEILGQTGHEDATIFLAQELQKKSHHEVVREHLIKILTQYNNPRTIHPYLEILRDAKESKSIKKQVLESLTQLHSLRNYSAEFAFSQHSLLEILEKVQHQSRDQHIKKLAIMNLFLHLPAHKVVPFFLRILEKGDEISKSICLRSCDQFRDPELDTIVKKFLNDPSPRIRGHAVIATTRLTGTGEKNTQIVKSLLEGKRTEEIIAGIYTAGEIGAEWTQGCIRRFLKHDDVNIQTHAAIALLKLGDKSAIKSLINIVLHGDITHSRNAIAMANRGLSEEISDALRYSIFCAVSVRVEEIIDQKKPTSVENRFKNISAEKIHWLKHFYRILGKYDRLAVLEGV